MNAGVIALFLIIAPVIFGIVSLVSLAARKISTQKIVVGLMALVMIFLSLMLFLEMYSAGSIRIAFDADEFDISGISIPVALLIAALGFALMIYFFVYRNQVEEYPWSRFCDTATDSSINH